MIFDQGRDVVTSTESSPSRLMSGGKAGLARLAKNHQKELLSGSRSLRSP